MEKIIIKKNGLIFENKKAIQGSPFRFLGQAIELEKGFLLRSFFKMISSYKQLIELSEVLESLIEIVSKQEMTGYKVEEIDSLIFYKTIEMKGFPGKPAINIYNSLKGAVGNDEKDLKFFHLETLLDHDIKLGELKHVVFGDKEDVFRYETVYTLFEFVEGIAWQLSFNFNPLHCSIRR